MINTIKRIVTLVFIVLIMAGCASQNEDSMLEMEYGHEDFEGKQYISVKAKLEWIGFKNIDTVFIDDLVSYGEIDDETVESVSINGNDTFKAGDKYDRDAPIKIVCHIVKKLECPLDDQQIRSASSRDLRDLFISYGFIDVKESVAYDLHPDFKNDEYMSQVLVDGKEINLNRSYPFDSEVEIVSHEVLDEFTLNIDINFIGNLLFNLYDVKVKLDNGDEFVLEHGEDISISITVNRGDFSLYFVVDNDRSINKTVTISDIKSNTYVKYDLRCEKDILNIGETLCERESISYFGK